MYSLNGLILGTCSVYNNLIYSVYISYDINPIYKHDIGLFEGIRYSREKRNSAVFVLDARE